MSTKRLEDHYNLKYKVTDGYTPVAAAIVDKPQSRAEMAAKIVASNPQGRYIEIGAGSGEVMLSAVDHYEQMIATEMSVERAQFMANNFKEVSDKIQVICNNIETDGLPYPDDYFDTAVMIAVIEHLIDPIMAVKELYRVLKPGGRLIIDTPNIAKWTRRIKLMMGYFPSTASLSEGLLCYDRKSPTDLYDEGHLHYFTYQSLVRVCVERAGFVRAEEFGYGKGALCRMWPQMFSDVCVVVYK